MLPSLGPFLRRRLLHLVLDEEGGVFFLFADNGPARTCRRVSEHKYEYCSCHRDILGPSYILSLFVPSSLTGGAPITPS